MRNSQSTGAYRKRITGQSVVESVIVIGSLATVSALAVLLGKVQIASQASSGAAHSLAFECAVMPQRCASPLASATPATTGRITQDHFTQSDNGLAQVAAWTDRAGTPLLEKTEHVSTSLQHPNFGAGKATKYINRFGLENSGLITSSVQLNLMKNAVGSGSPDLLNRMPLSFAAKSAILTDHWNASNPYGTAPTSVQVRVDKGKELPKAIETGFKIAYAPTRASMLFMWGLLLESDARKFKYHEVDMDLIPADRMGK